MVEHGPAGQRAAAQERAGGRLDRAFANFKETFPFFAACVLALAVLGRHSSLTVWGSELYFAGRVLYLPLHAAGIPVLRTMAWAIATFGIVLLLSALL